METGRTVSFSLAKGGTTKTTSRLPSVSTDVRSLLLITIRRVTLPRHWVMTRLPLNRHLL